MRNIVQAVLLLGLILISLPNLAFAAGWPDNWLGPADNNYVHLRIGVFYYGAVLDDLPAETGGKSPLPIEGIDGGSVPGSFEEWSTELNSLPEQSRASRQREFDRCMAELHENARFYWRNTRFNCAITFENIETGFDPLLRSSLLSNNPPYNSPVDFPKYAGYREQYDGLLHICVLYKYNPDIGGLERVRGGGGWTWGAELDNSGDVFKRLCGWSWWNSPPDWHDCGNDWLFCHEFGHQLDSLFHVSDRPEHWFNHLARLEANTARFGEHFDAMSYILRRTPEADWSDLAPYWGEEKSYQDNDGDGMPDADDWLLAHGFETDPDPSEPDSDGDGLSDREEALAMNGNRVGHGERLHPALDFIDPLNPDSDDHDWIDGSDPLPWLPAEPVIARFEKEKYDESVGEWDFLEPAREWSHTFYIDLKGSDSAQPLFSGMYYVPDGSLVLFVAWGDPAPDKPDSEVRISLDLENDGWFNGDDNYRLHLDSTGIVYASINRAASYTEWPVEDRGGVDQSAIGFEWKAVPSGYRYSARLQFDKTHFPALHCKAGERIGVNIGVRNTGTRWFYTFGEPNSFVTLELR